MSDKRINYTARNFDDYHSELIKLSKKYYPELSDNFNDASVGAWFIDLISAVSDELSYHIDRAYQESNVNMANTKKSLLNLARTNGVKVPGPKASICEVLLSCDMPSDRVNISLPDWDYSPIIKRSTVVSSGNFNYELTEDVNFKEQFNSDGFSNRTFVPKRDSNGIITGYTVTKSTIVVGGTSRVYKKVLTEDELKPFFEVVLPEKDVMNIESIIFKASSDFLSDPQLSEYYFDDEVITFNGQDAHTYRYFEVDSLASQYRFGTVMENDVEKYDDYTETTDSGNTRTTRIYRGEWKPIRQKFITEYTDNGYLKVIFGSGVLYEDVPKDVSNFAEYQMSKLINNDMLGVLPEAGWTMYILYRVGGGVETNVAQGAINTINYLSAEIPTPTNDAQQRSNVIQSIKVSNTTTSVSGKDAPSANELKYLVKYNTSSQNRCVTVKDYQAQILQMSPKYGCPFRSSVIEDNNKILISTLGVNADGDLDKGLPQTLVNNMVEYLSNYRTINDYIEIKSGRIYNVGFEIDLFIDKNYNAPDVVKNVINTVKSYMDINNHEMGEDIFVGDLERVINDIDGVISLINMRVYSLYSTKHGYNDKSPLPQVNADGNACTSSSKSSFSYEGDEGTSHEIDLDAIDYVLYGDFNSMYEIKKDNDIQIKYKLK